MEENKLQPANEELAAIWKDFYVTFSSPHGQRVLKVLERECKQFSFASGDIWETFRRTIYRDVIEYIKDKVDAGAQITLEGE